MSLRRDGGLWLMGIAIVAVLLGAIGQPGQDAIERHARAVATPTAAPKPHQPKPQRRHGKHRMATAHVLGAGSPGWIGDYPESGTHEGQPYYQFDGSHFLIWNGSVWCLVDTLTPSSDTYYYADDTIDSMWNVGSLGASGPAPTVTLGAVGPPAAPKVPDRFSKALIGTEGGAGTFTIVAEDPLPAGATGLKLLGLINTQDDNLDMFGVPPAGGGPFIEGVLAGETVELDTFEGEFGQLQWVAVNDAGETPGPRMMYHMGPYEASVVRTPPPPDISNVTAHTFDVTRVVDLVETPANALIGRVFTEHGDDYWTDPASPGGFARSAYPDWSAGDSRTLPDSGTVPSTPLSPGLSYGTRWQAPAGGPFAIELYGPVIGLSTASHATTPPPPLITGYTDSDPTTATVTAPATLPGDLVSLDYYQRVVGGAYALVQSGITGGGTVALTGLVAGQPYQGYWRGFNSVGDYADGPAAAFTPSVAGDPPPAAPEAPDECRATDLQDVRVTIIMPALPVRAAELWLQQKISGVWTTIRTGLTAAAEVVVESLTLSTDYDFRAVASNDFGQTPGSACDLRTEALPTPDPDAPAETTLAWLEPAAGAVLSGPVLLRFRVTDTGGVTTGHAIMINGQTVPGVHRVSGTSGNGIYAAVFEARDSANGAATGVISVTGSDSEVATATRAFTVDNGRTAGTKYLPLTQLFDAPDGKRFCALRSFTCDRPALSGNAGRRYWMQAALTTAAAAFDAVNWHGTGDEAKAAQAAAWGTLQPVPLSLTNAPRPQITGQAAIAVRGTMARLCCRLTPRQAYSAFETGLGAVVRIRRYADGDYIVLARNLDGTGAAVWRYNSDGFNLLVDLADYGAEDATDAMLIAADKLHVMRPGEVFILDLESGNVSVNLLPRDEDRAPFRVERLADGRALWLFVTAGHSGGDSRAYVYKAGEVKPVWSWPAALTLSQRVGDVFRFAADAALLASDGETMPAVVETLGAAITAIDDVTGAAVMAPDQARSGWQGAADMVRGVAGQDSADLFTQDAAGDWVLDETLVAPAALEATIDEITVLARYTLNNADGVPLPDRLLIGTAPDGLFLVLERAALSAASGAVEVSDFGGSATAIFGTELIP